jgi:tetratricopeptide (TPR) repeat protein
VTEESVSRRELEAKVERWTAEAKRHLETGDESGALGLYRKAADELPGAPWLQHRTAELARKLKQTDAALLYYRRAATAFQLAEFPKRAIAPLRTSWTMAVESLPATSKPLVDIALDLIRIQKRLGLAADAQVTLERTNAALRGRGFSELSPHALASPERAPASGRAALAVEPPASFGRSG